MSFAHRLYFQLKREIVDNHTLLRIAGEIQEKRYERRK